MNGAICGKNLRILLIDDNKAIHSGIRKILTGNEASAPAFDKAEAALLGESSEAMPFMRFEVDSAYQGQEGLDLLRRAVQAGRPYAMAFVDVRMPPGWDGVETTARLWQEDPRLQVVLCTAYSDYSWGQTLHKLGEGDRLLILKKPFENIEVRQLALALTEKWNLARQAEQKLHELDQAVREQNRELQEQTKHLENTVRQLNQAHAQLMQAQKLESIGRLAVGIAHEINQPLSAIMTYVEACSLAARSADGIPGKIVDDLEQIASQADRADDIIQRLRALVRNEKPNCATLDINKLIREVMHFAGPELQSKGIRLRLDLCTNAPTVLADPVQVQLVILNLVRNAIEAMNENESEVGDRELTVRTSEAKSDVVETIVRDTGPGLSNEILDQLFDPFFTTKSGGMGMGLAISRSIIKTHKGCLGAMQNPKGGATFRFTLPAST